MLTQLPKKMVGVVGLELYGVWPYYIATGMIFVMTMHLWVARMAARDVAHQMMWIALQEVDNARLKRKPTAVPDGGGTGRGLAAGRGEGERRGPNASEPGWEPGWMQRTFEDPQRKPFSAYKHLRRKAP